MSKLCVAPLGALAALLSASSASAEEASAAPAAGSGSALPAERANVESSSADDAGGRPDRGMHNSISLLANFGYAYAQGTGFGLSGRYQYSIVPTGFLRGGSIRDDLGVEAALDYFRYSLDFAGAHATYNEFGISASAVWNVWFSEQIAAYPRLGLGFAAGKFSDDLGGTTIVGFGGFFLVGGAGFLYELEPLTLRLEFGNRSVGLGAAISL